MCNHAIDTTVDYQVTDIPKFDDDCSLLVTKTLGLPKVRKFYTIPHLSNSVLFTAHNNSLVNVLRGIVERVFFVKGCDGSLQRPPKPVNRIYSTRLGEFRGRLLVRTNPTTQITTQKFLDYYKGRKRSVYEKAAASLFNFPVVRRDSIARTFVKFEKIRVSKGDVAPRVIQPRDPRYNLSIGVFLKPLEHNIYAGIAEVFGSITVFKGLNAYQQGQEMEKKWRRFGSPVAIGLDASRFDQHVSVQALEWEHSIYNAMFHSPELAKLLTWQIKNKAVAYTRTGSVKYTVNGCRFSGDMNTALGNCLIMCGLIYSYCKVKCIDVELANNGDDCTCIINRSNLDKFNDGLTEWFTEMGFSMKVEEPVFEFERIEFCQTHPVLGPNGYVMVRDPRLVLGKDNVFLYDLDTASKQSTYLSVIGEGGLSLSSGIPIMQDFYNMYSKFKTVERIKRHYFELHKNSGFHMLSIGMDHKYVAPSDASRFSFWLAFGITPEEQICCEEFYSTKTVALGVPRLEPCCPTNMWMPTF